MIIFKKYYFDAAHYMPEFKKNHKYKKVHGHSYEIIIKLKGELDPKNNWVMDLEKLDSYVNPELSKLDHSILNEVNCTEIPNINLLKKSL